MPQAIYTRQTWHSIGTATDLDAGPDLTSLDALTGPFDLQGPWPPTSVRMNDETSDPEIHTDQRRSTAQAAALGRTDVVTSDADMGPGSLRAVLGAAASGDTIVFDPNVYSVNLQTRLDSAANVTIDGSAGRPAGGTIVLLGSGQLVLAGTYNLGPVQISNGLLFRNNGTVTQTGSVLNPSGKVTNGAGHLWNIAGDLNIIGGSPSAGGGGGFNNGGGTLTKTSGTGITNIQGIFENTSGTLGNIVISAGSMRFSGYGVNLFNENISGPGTFILGDGQFELSATTSISAATFSIQSGASVVIHDSFTYQNVFNMEGNSYLVLFSNNISLNGGTINPSDAGIPTINSLTGHGSFTNTGHMSISGLSLGSDFHNFGQVNENGNISVSSGSIYAETGSQWTLTGTSRSGFFQDYGATLIKSDNATSTISGFRKQASNLGNIIISQGVLKLLGFGIIDHENISGSGSFQISGGGSVSIGTGTTLSTAGFTVATVGTHVSLASDLSYSGSFLDKNATVIDLGTQTLELSGSAVFSDAVFNAEKIATPTVIGSGKLLLSGTTTIDGLSIGGATVVRTNGSVTQTRTVTVGDSSGGAVRVTTGAGHSWQISGDVDIKAGNAVSNFNVGGGTLIKSSGTGVSTIGVNIINLSTGVGHVEVASGILDLHGELGTGLALQVDAGTTLILDQVVAAGTDASFNGAGATLQLNDAQQFAGSITGFGAGKMLDLGSIGFAGGTTLAYADNGSSGTLTVGDGTHTAALALNGSFAAASFHLGSDGHNGSLVTYG